MALSEGVGVLVWREEGVEVTVCGGCGFAAGS